jgi:hypothetical protein
MGRKPIGDKPLSAAERSSRLRSRRTARWQACQTWREALERIATLADCEARQIAVEALAAKP